ncbi:Uncharacterised protein [Enterobacter cloacae]|nr:Uncharacterised protein [Enterobacter cloacae]
MTNQFRDQPTGLIVRQHVIPFAVDAFHRIPQQHARQAKLPGMLAGRRQFELLDVIIVDTPADTRFVDPLAQIAQPLFVNVETCGQNRHIQQCQHILRDKPAIRQRKQADKGL